MSTLIHLNGLLDGILDAIFGWIIDFFMGLLNLILSAVYTIAFGAFCAIIDACQYIFRIFAGTADAIYTEAGENIFGGENLFGDPTGNILFDFLMSSTVISIFVKLTVLSLFLIIIFTIVAIVKQEYATEVTKPENNKMAIVAKSGRALMSIIFIPIICIFGIYASNMILKAVDLATSNGGNSLGARIFVASSFNANRARIDEEFYKALCGRESEYTLHNTFNGYFADGATNTDKGMDIVATNVDEAFLANAPFPKKTQNNNPSGSGDDNTDTGDQNNNPTTDDDDRMEWVYGDTFGTGIKYTFAFTTPEASTTFSVNNFTVAHYYYDLWKFDYVVAAVTGIFMTFMFLKLLITLAKRIYEIILLFLASPVVASMMPLDGGNALKDWRKQFVAKIFMIYGPVVAMNLFISIFGLFTSVDSLSTIVNVLLTSFGITEEPLSFVGPAALPFLDASSAIYKKLPLLYQAYQLILCIFMCAGVMVVDQTSKWVSSWIGAEDALAVANKNNETFKNQMTSSAAKGAYVLSKTGGAVGGAFKAVGKVVSKAPASVKATGAAISAGWSKTRGAVERDNARDMMYGEASDRFDDINERRRSGEITWREARQEKKAVKDQVRRDVADLDNMKSEYTQLTKGGMSSSDASAHLREKYKVEEASAQDAYIKGLERSARGKEKLTEARDIMTLGLRGFNKTKRQSEQYNNRFPEGNSRFTNGKGQESSNQNKNNDSGENERGYRPLTTHQKAEQKRMEARVRKAKKAQEKKELHAELKQTWRKADQKINELRK